MIVALFGVRPGVCVVTALAALSVVMTACQPPSIDGTSYTKDKNTRSSKATNAAEDEEEEETETAEDPLTTGTPKTSAPDAGQIAIPVPTTTTTTTPPPPPPVTHPNCQSSNPLNCLDCCLGANPQAAAFEFAYEDCIDGCFDSACDQQCQDQHVTACAGNAACSKNHACMEANDCLAQNFCD